jgi:hypothetical protein
LFVNVFPLLKSLIAFVSLANQYILRNGTAMQSDR